MLRDVLARLPSGVVVIDHRDRVQVWNAAAARDLAIRLEPGTDVSALDPSTVDPTILAALAKTEATDDSPEVVAGRTMRVRRHPLTAWGRPAGRAIVLDDRTEVLRLTTQRDAERDSHLALRVRAHETDNRLHTIVALLELGHVDQAHDFATAVLTRSAQVHETIHAAVTDPRAAVLLIDRTIGAQEAGVVLHLDPATDLPPTRTTPEDLVVVLGTLVDRGVAAAVATPPPRWVHVLAYPVGDGLRIAVSDSGIPPPASADTAELGLEAVAATVRRLGGALRMERWVGARCVVDLP